MSWNYRVMKRLNSIGEFEYGIYEVYYDEKGNINGWTKKSLVPVCPSVEGLIYEFEIMKVAFKEETLIYKE